MAHPQIAIAALSLMRPEEAGLHIPEATDKSLRNQTANAYWLNAAKLITWMTPPTVAYGVAKGDSSPSWFPDATMNTCYNALDRHVDAGFGDRVAFHHYSPLPAQGHPTASKTYAEMLWDVSVLAGVLRNKLGVRKGDTVIIYFSASIEAATAALACARIGAIHSTVFGGFAPKELAKRIDDAKPRAILASSCGIEPKGVIEYKPLLDAALKLVSVKRPPVLMLRRKNIKGHSAPKLSGSHREYDYEIECDIVRRSKKRALLVEKCVEMKSSDPLYILYTSGSTGTPKGVVRDNGGHAVVSRSSIQYNFGLSREDTIFCASDLGWVVGHSYIAYAPLLLGCTSIIFEGKPVLPDAGVFWKIVEKYKVSCLYTAPTALRAIRREDPDAELMGKYDLTSLRSLFLAGERSEPGIVSRYQFLLEKMAAKGAIVVDNYWSTESGSPITSIAINKSYPPLAVRPGSAGLPLPGMDLRVVDDEGKEVKRGEMGNIVLGLPLPPSALIGVWNAPERFREAYFLRFENKGNWFDTGDAGCIDDAGYVSVLSRGDDLLNVAGHRLGTSLIEQIVASSPYVSEACIVGMPDPIKGHVPFAVIIRGVSKEAQEADIATILEQVNKAVRADIGAIASLGGLVAARLPKTRSGKTLRRTIRALVEGAYEGKYEAEAAFPATIDDATAVDDARQNINEYFKNGAGRDAGKVKAKL